MSTLRIFAVALIVSHFGACSCGSSGGGAGSECLTGIDFDGDGYGVGCEAGDDCNDSDPGVNVDCCAGGAAFTGCDCDPALDGEVACFDGDEALIGVGTCQGGTRTCNPEGVWSSCVGQTAPTFETCDNGGDNDCDGNVDEGVLSACGNCMPGCEDVGVDDDPFPLPEDDPNVESEGVGLDPNGDLVLDSRNVDTFFLWIANDTEGTVSKIDTRTGREVGRYPSVVKDTRLIVPIDETTGNPFPTAAGTSWDPALVQDWNTDRNTPSRTAIDGNQDMWVANRAHQPSNSTQQTSATKVYNDPEDCIDFNNDGIIETSRDLDNDGRISLTTTCAGEIDTGCQVGGTVTLREFYPNDECVAMTVVLGPVTANARALAIDAGSVDIDTGQPNPNDPGSAWVGMHNEQTFYRVTVAGKGSPTTSPEATALRVALPSGHTPYGAAIDSNGIVWSADACCDGNSFVGIDSTVNPPALVQDPEGAVGDFVHTATVGGNGFYGMVVDLENRIWAANIQNDHLWRYNPDPAFAGTRWETIDLANFLDENGNPDSQSGTRTRGIAIDINGDIWAAIDNESSGYAIKVDADDLGATPQRWTLSGSTPNPIGIGVDFDGNVWTANRSGDTVDRLYIDPANNGNPSPASTHPDTGRLVDTFPVGNDPYTYSDFTGLSRRIVTNPQGTYQVPVQGCVDGAEAIWSGVEFDVTTPAETFVEVYVQVGNNPDTLEDQTLYGPWTSSPADLTTAPGPVPEGTYLLLTIVLRSEDREATPIVHGYSVEWTCPGPQIE